jgi:KaiC/GvpD/RAD55 family RecA-like ATPase/5S rRNA maturation endonuclease (ribonuclease M5)
MNAFEEFNQLTMDDVAGFLGMQKGRMRSYGSCPACGAEKRGSTDSRLPIGVTPNSRGWHCFKCSVSGNMVDLLSYSIGSSIYKECSESSKEQILEWLLERGFGEQKVEKKFTSSSKITSKVIEREQPKPKIDTTSDFRWEKDLWRQYKANLNSEQGKNVLEYLINERKFTKQMIDLYDLGAMFANGVEWLVIPFHDPTGKVVNMKFRSINTEKKQYRACRGCPQVLYSAQFLSKKKVDPVIIVEGEMDVIAMRCYGYNNVVSATTGAGTNWSDEFLDQIEQYKSFSIFYDNDQSGDSGAINLAKKIGTYRAFRVKDDVFKDANEMLSNGVPDTYIQKLIDDGEAFVDTKLKRVGAYQQQIEDLVLNPVATKGVKTGIVKFDELIGGVRAGLWVVSGDTGHGKTTFLTHIVWRLALKQLPVLVTSFEQQPIGTVQKLLRNQVGDDFTKVSKESRVQAFRDLNKLPIHIYDHYGEIHLSEVIEAIRFAARRFDVKVALVDHLGFLVKTDKNTDERQAIERAVRELATIAVQDDITIMLVCHPNNTSVNQQRRVKITDLKGASAIRQDAHIGMIVERQERDDKSPFPTSRVYLDKCRSEFGQSGTNTVLAFDPLSCYYDDDWQKTPSGKKGKKVVSPNAKKGRNMVIPPNARRP